MKNDVKCRVANCVYWSNNECTADSIMVAVQGTPANASANADRDTECETFKKRS